MSLRVGIFGGSFNPPHIGHQAICSWLLKYGGLVDLVCVVPCFIHPFNKKLASFEDRYKMCLFTFKKFGEKAFVSRIEQTLGGVSHTIRTIKELQKSYPDYTFSLVAGEDIKNYADKWKDFDEIKSLVPLITIPRGPKSPIPDISATVIRDKISRGESVAEFLPSEVAVYIVTHGLYR